MDEHITSPQLSLPVRAVKYWLPVALIIGGMYYLSTDEFSAENTRSLIEKIYLWFQPHAGHHALAVLNFIIRKSAHFIEYAILGALLFRAFRMEGPERWRLKWAVYAFLTAASWSLLDEFHQTFTHSRTGSIRDSLIDSTGALFALAMIALYSTRRRSRRSE